MIDGIWVVDMIISIFSKRACRPTLLVQYPLEAGIRIVSLSEQGVGRVCVGTQRHVLRTLYYTKGQLNGCCSGTIKRKDDIQSSLLKLVDSRGDPVPCCYPR